MDIERTSLSGTQYEIAANGYRAVIAGVGATLRSLTFEGRDLVVPFEAEELRPNFRGATLAPWPNRVVDGRYSRYGEELQLSISEPKRGHALHGLASWLRFEAVEHSATRVVLEAAVEPQAGFPHRILVTVAFSLGSSGLTWTVSGRNLGPRPAPFGTAPHPYLVAGTGLVDGWRLTLPAARVQTVTADRLVPIDVVDVETHEGGRFDFRAGRVLGDTFLDNAYTGVTRDGDGMATVTVTDPDGAGVGMRFGADSPWVQVHTADLPEAPERSRIGLAVEPMTCPPGALNSDTDVLDLAPGASATVTWELFAV